MTVVGMIALKIIDIKNLWMLLILGVIYVIIFGIGSWLIEMNTYEKTLVSGMINKIIRIKKRGER